MTKLTNKEKIKKLRKLLWFNFRYNFMNRNIRGLCGLYKKLYNIPSYGLFDEIPELYEFRTRGSNVDYYWWPRGRIVGWWYRHWAIIRTISKLKRSS